MVAKEVIRSPARSVAASEWLRKPRQRVSTAPRMPSACTMSPCWRMVSAKASLCIEAMLASASGRRVIIWLRMVMTISTSAPATERCPSQGWKV